MRTWLPALALATVIAAPARAEGDYNSGLYLGTGNHVKISTGFGIMSGFSTLIGAERGSVFSFVPTIEGRFKLGEQFGLQVVLPLAMVDISIDDGDSEMRFDETRFDLGNPSVAFEAVLAESGLSATIVRGGLTLPLLNAPDSVLDALVMGINARMALGIHGLFNSWRYLPETMSAFGEIVSTVDSGGLFMEFTGGLGILIPTSDNRDVEVVLQGSAKIGGGGKVIGFGGLGVVLIASSLGEEGADAAQLSLQGGIIAQLGRVRLDAAVHLNLDKPDGFSFDDGGIFGVNAAVTIPF